MTRKEEIEKYARECAGNQIHCVEIDVSHACEWADKTMIERLCRCYCDDICERGMSGMCFHKHDWQGQVKNDFEYNECNELKLLHYAAEK